MYTEKKLDKQFRLFTFFALLGILLVACGGSAQPTEPAPLETTITALDIKWDTENLEAKAGQKITLTLVNDGLLDHNFKVTELGIDINIAAGATEMTTFIIAESGTFEYFCNVPGHLEAGMTGTITVSE